MRVFTRVSAAVAVSLSLAATAAQAQTASANINARADVRQQITVTGVRDLDFGVAIQGVNKTVGVTSTSSGQYSSTGTAASNVAITFALPTNLASGANLLAINTWTGCFNGAAANASVGCTAFTPAAAATNTTFGAAGLFVFVGATVAPTAAQAVGIYISTVTMTLTYF